MRIMLSLLWAAGIAVLALTMAKPVRGNAATRADDNNGNPTNGRKVFLRENCYICHGGRGGGGMCPSLRDNRPDESDVQDFVLNGSRSGMPSFRGRVTTQEIADLAAYFKTLRSPQEPTFTHWWEAVPTQ
jgi:mono/diheme cytochrome c family protein